MVTIKTTLHGLCHGDILTRRYTWICGSEGMFERLGHQSGHTGLWTLVLIPNFRT